MKKQQGLALLSVLFITAVAAMLASDAMESMQYDAYRNTAFLRSEQAWQYHLAAEQWIRNTLFDDRADSSHDSNLESWARPVAGWPVEGGLVRGAVMDLDGRLNINALITGSGVNTVQLARFRRLFIQLEIDPNLLERLLDWLDADDVPRNNGAENSFYRTMSPPASARNAIMQDVSELEIVFADLPQEKRQQLTRLLAALDSQAMLNVNTAPREVLASLAKGISPEQLSSLYLEGKADFKSMEQWQKHLTEKGIVIENIEGLGVKSHYFRMQTSVYLDGGRFDYQALVHRGSTGIRVLSRNRSY